jgi:hypothetical protein
MIGWQECDQLQAAPDYTSAMPKEREGRRRSVRSKTLSPFEGSGDCAVRIRSVAQRGAVSVEACIWIASYLLAILGLIKAAYSHHPLLWLAVWPAPVALASTIFIFFRQGFRFQDGVLVFGRRPKTDRGTDSGSPPGRKKTAKIP